MNKPSGSAASSSGSGSGSGGGKPPLDLTAPIHYCVDKLVRQQEEELGCSLDSGARYLIGQMAIEYSNLIASDALHFAKHRGRQNIDAQDVALVARKDRFLTARLSALQEKLGKQAADAKAAAASAAADDGDCEGGSSKAAKKPRTSGGVKKNKSAGGGGGAAAAASASAAAAASDDAPAAVEAAAGDEDR